MEAGREPKERIVFVFFSQVGKLYIYYRLEQPDESPIVESEDIVCLLKDRKELYIQKDHLSSKMAICRYFSSDYTRPRHVLSTLWVVVKVLLCCFDCRELVKLFTTEKSFAEELKAFLEELAIRISVSIITTLAAGLFADILVEFNIEIRFKF